MTRYTLGIGLQNQAILMDTWLVRLCDMFKESRFYPSFITSGGAYVLSKGALKKFVEDSLPTCNVNDDRANTDEEAEDFAWENDRIAFRMYGKELEKTPAEN